MAESDEMTDVPAQDLDLSILEGITPFPWRVYVQEIADKEQAKKELCDLIEGTPNFQPRLVYVTDDEWDLAVCITGCGERSEANAHAIAALPAMKREIKQWLKLKEYAKSLGQETYLDLHAENVRLRALNAGLAKHLEEADELLEIAYYAHQKMGLEGRGNAGLPHETRIFAMHFSQPETPRTLEHVILSGDGRYWRFRTRDILAKANPSTSSQEGEGK
jgi:hypothetical protein